MAEVIEATEAVIMFAAGYLAGSMDHRFNLRNEWSLKVHDDIEIRKKPATIEYLYKLEAAIRRRWPEGERPPSIADVLGRAAEVRQPINSRLSRGRRKGGLNSKRQQRTPIVLPGSQFA